MQTLETLRRYPDSPPNKSIHPSVPVVGASRTACVLAAITPPPCGRWVRTRSRSPGSGPPATPRRSLWTVPTAGGPSAATTAPHRGRQVQRSSSRPHWFGARDRRRQATQSDTYWAGRSPRQIPESRTLLTRPSPPMAPWLQRDLRRRALRDMRQRMRQHPLLPRPLPSETVQSPAASVCPLCPKHGK